MAETYGLSVVHVEPVRRIAARVASSPAAGRYFAIGSSSAVQARVTAAFQAILGVDNVVPLDLGSAPHDPWNQVRAHQNNTGRGAQGVLYIVRGLRTAGSGDDGAHPYAQLNLSRDAWGATGTHLLVWIEGIEEFDRFLHLAPDLWSHRDVVSWFLSREDFPVGEGAVAVSESLAAKERAAREAADAPGASPLDVVRANTELAEALNEQGRHVEAWERIEVATRAATRVRDAEGWDVAQLAIAEVYVLRDLGRPGQALLTSRKLADAFRSAPKWLRRTIRSRGVIALDSNARREINELRGLVREVAPEEDGTAFAAWTNLVDALCRYGHLREADALLRHDLVRNEAEWLTEAWIGMRRATLAEGRGDYAAVLREHDRAARRFAVGGMPRMAATSLEDGARVLDEWGLVDEAESLFRASAALTEGQDPDARTRAWPDLWRRGATSADAALARILDDAEAWAGSWPSRGLAAGVFDFLLDHLEDDALPDDPILARIERSLLVVYQAARSDPEIEGAVAWSQTRLAQVRRDHKRAFSLADGVLIPWARRWRGPTTEATAWRLLATSAPTPKQAEEFATRAIRMTNEDASLPARIGARVTAAEVAVRAGQVDRAAEHLDIALAVARPEGLRLQELRLLHLLAELPGHPRAVDAAGAALTLSGALMLPRDEARALLNLANTERPGSPLARRRLERAHELVVALGPPRLRARVEQALRSAGRA